MSYQALARRWRPRHFKDVVGQEHVVSALTSALDNERVHHAFLFSGTRGVGKTTLARLLAKALNCEQGVSSQPCGSCSACQGVDEGRFIDLLEVDAASRTRVDDTREILDNVQYTPTQGRCKVYLIDEVHMLSGHSFNALLKTLEEPPDHVKFLLATTDPQKLPATIISRCLQFNLRALSPDQIAAQLDKILIAEEIKHDSESLDIIARAASGSMRDALSLLDQGIAFGSGHVSADSMRDMLGMIETRHVEHILRGLTAHDGASVLAVADDMAERALDYMSALDDLLLALQDVAVYQVSPQGYAAKGEVSAFTTELGGLMSPEDVQLYYQIALLAKRDLHLAPDPGSGFQMALLRMLTFIPDLVEDSAPSTGLPERPQKKSASKAKSVRQKPARVRNDVRGEVGAESPKRVPIEVSNSTDADPADPEIWTDLVATADLTGITRELAMNLAPQRFIQGVLEVSLVESLEHLANDARIKTLEKSLSAQRKDVLKLKLVEPMEDTVSSPTPVQTEKRQADEAKQAAYQSMLEDPAVQEMMKRFDATVVPESVRPAKSEEVGK